MKRLPLKQMILNELDKHPRGYSEELAKIAGYSTGSALRKVLNDPKKEFDKVNGLIKVVQTLFPSDEIQLMSNYALTLDFNKNTARCMLEYAEIHKLQGIRTELITKMMDCSNAQSKQWAHIHEIDMRMTSKEIDYLEALSLLENISVKNTEMQIIKTIYKSYCYLEVQLYDSVLLLLGNIDNVVKDMKNDFMRDVIVGRYYTTLAECYARMGNIEESRKYANKLVEDTNINIYEGWGLLHLGNSYLLENYNKSNEYLIKGKEITKELSKNTLENIKRSMNFLDNLWKKEPRELDLNSTHPSDIHEIAFYYINHNQLTMATSLLNDENLSELTHNQLGFHWYLKGLISNRLDDFCQSVKYFKLSGDKRYCQLPLIELKKLNVQECIIEALSI